MRVGVVGGDRFLSAHIVDQLRRSGFEPVAVGSGPHQARGVTSGPGGEPWDAPLGGAATLRTTIDGCAYVHILGSARGEPTDAAARGWVGRTARGGVAGVLDALQAARDARVQRVIVAGCCGTRGGGAGVPVDEDAPQTEVSESRDPFVRRKVIEEQAIAEFVQAADLKTVTILAGDIVGPQDSYPTPLGASLVGRLNGDPASSLGVEGSFPVVDVRDVARAHVLAMDVATPSPAYLVVGATVTAREWADAFSRVTGLPNDDRLIRASVAMAMAFVMEAFGQITGSPAWLDRNAVRQTQHIEQYDCRRAQSELGLRFTPLETTIRDAVAWYTRNGWITDEARRAIVDSALARAAHDAALPSLSRKASRVGVR